MNNKNKMIFFEIPPRYKTKKPAEAIKIDVPKSGCLTIKNKGTAIIIVPSIKFKAENFGPSNFSYNQASNKGTPIFINSDGCNLKKPKSSHLFAPLIFVPKNSTNISNNKPKK